jgi:hypothetical protein
MRGEPFRTRGHLRQDETPSGEGGAASSDALRIIDRALRDFAGRRLVSPAEVLDVLLDLRFAIMLDAQSQDLRVELEVR